MRVFSFRGRWLFTFCFYNCIILCMFCLTKDMDFSAFYFIIKERMKEED
ncbi:hypothetical protein CLOSTHATH_00258 [Hungatella hathewayi DSM 13479]|uniref:Uncharacterized protein n=1 Tax=Hungatella hathewayi DSM 13479 TaxID=566550 RepID=D3A9I8_9FIRM|nr:hypothetical protein CLOSTHATH_00258 [Hungatella hathewayi DSM 13479]